MPFTPINQSGRGSADGPVLVSRGDKVFQCKQTGSGRGRAKSPAKTYAAESGFMRGKCREQNLFTSFFVPVLMRIEPGGLLRERRRDGARRAIDQNNRNGGSVIEAMNMMELPGCD